MHAIHATAAAIAAVPGHRMPDVHPQRKGGKDGQLEEHGARGREPRRGECRPQRLRKGLPLGLGSERGASFRHRA